MHTIHWKQTDAHLLWMTIHVLTIILKQYWIALTIKELGSDYTLVLFPVCSQQKLIDWKASENQMAQIQRPGITLTPMSECCVSVLQKVSVCCQQMATECTCTGNSSEKSWSI